MARNAGITDDMVVEMYKDGMPYKQMSKIIGITDRAIRNILYKKGIDVKRLGPPRKHSVNEDFFDFWSHEMAWVLGIIITDGNIPMKNYSTITITQKDERILKLIANYMGTDYNIGAIYETRKTPTLFIHSAKIRKKLNQLGISANKSSNVLFPPVPEVYLPSFIRGVIDGDGWVQNRGYVMNITTASPEFAKGLETIFRLWKLNTEITTESSLKGTIIYRVWVKGKKDVAQLARIIYEQCKDDCNIKKRERMSQYL
ncbi:hypothetical protein D1B31_05855 [Neobacillus notoginsengisoli]|uniref:DOD-type homing endonuclease domain-containing protein n=1 Tax=Neobacillus notoginsengisoli TaxID=1578198 RepID=A0A417YXA2_9BACI|nr:LAGLIDADG family homing endonuclease [Neobacillus notoginsengisoli]RHW42159.1 hypothetical protein D1B31_05855 [Neobacillus notoginsengisoli]